MLQLTQEELLILGGEYGRGMAKALEFQVALGESFDAERMIEVSRVHAPLTQLDGDNWFAADLLKHGGACRVAATTNPIYDVKYLENIGTPEPEDDARLIHAVKDRFNKLGLVPSLSCIPQLESNTPRFGEVCSFSESSAVPYVNGVIGARTNRESAKSALAAAITGRVPEYGLLLDENRLGDTLITVEAELRNEFDYRLLGFTIGKLMGNGIPVLEIAPKKPSPEELLNLCTDMNVSAAVAMVHIVGVTPEAQTREQAFGGEKPKKQFTITNNHLAETQRSLCDFESGPINFALFGCAHYTLEQVRRVAALLEGKTIARDVEFWVLTSPQTRNIASEMGLLAKIEAAGGHIIGGTCSVMPCWDRRFMGKPGVSDSLKARFYNAKTGIRYKVMALEECVEAALAGGCK